jgi:phage I-like protein
MPQGVHFQSFTADGVAPEWLHIVPAGRFSGADGRGPYLLADAAALITASMQAGKLPLDENHSTDLAAPKGEPSPARGWLVEMQSRADGIWARVEWTEEGRALVAGHAYRGVSPVFTTDGKGTLTRILRAALTNNPNLADLATLHNPENTMDLPRLRGLLGLPDTADEAAVSAAIAARTEAATAHASLLADLAGQFGVAAEAAPVLAAVAAQRQAAIPPATVIALQTQLATLQASHARGIAVAAIDGAITAGKPIAPLRDHYITRHMANAAQVEAELAALPSLHAGGIGGRPATGGSADEPTELESTVAKKMGLDPKALAKQRADRMKTETR